jgi:hypothetical protein
MAKKTQAELAADIAAALARPLARLSAKGSFSEHVQQVGQRSKLRQKALHQALLKHPALIVTDESGRRTLLIRSGEMSNPEEGPHRVTQYLEDGPLGHIARKSITKLAQDLSRDLAPVKIDPASEAQVIAWMTTPVYEEGLTRVLEMQRRNARR